jgi:sec-independent protein translocase protein TatA
MFSPKGPEWIIILVVVLLIFGARKLPELARSLGASAKEFRKGIQEGSEEAAATTETPPKTENNS